LILIAGFLKYPPGGIDKLRGEMEKVVEATRREDGCINYDFAIDISDPTRLIVFERWRDQDALDAHIKSAHIAAWRAAGAAAGPAERHLTVWEVDEGRAL
jgi:quinol monooxygenase YgiN